MICSIIDECRCFAYDDVINPKKSQFCGVRRGPNVLQCPESECCYGGCPGQTPGVTPKEPFRIIERPSSSSEFSLKFYMLVLLIMLSILFLTYIT